jgi:hypothetical protein
MGTYISVILSAVEESPALRTTQVNCHHEAVVATEGSAVPPQDRIRALTAVAFAFSGLPYL